MMRRILFVTEFNNSLYLVKINYSYLNIGEKNAKK